MFAWGSTRRPVKGGRAFPSGANEPARVLLRERANGTEPTPPKRGNLHHQRKVEQKNNHKDYGHPFTTREVQGNPTTRARATPTTIRARATNTTEGVTAIPPPLEHRGSRGKGPPACSQLKNRATHWPRTRRARLSARHHGQRKNCTWQLPARRNRPGRTCTRRR